ncbi:MAG: efflux RND transporter periplasmic adaptor subunit [Candidatus Methylopumilus sp.]|nr:efflux RND transporter periplasmic adaptor subunit [Candidatus Methylopumilus sp.]
MKKYLFYFLLILSLATSGLVGCSKKQEVAKEGKKDPLEIFITPIIRSQIKIDKADKAEISEAVNVPGRIEVQQNRLAKIGSPVTGRVSDIQVSLGQIVKSGQILAKVNSVELTQTQLTFIKAKQQIGLKTKAVERAKLLFDADVISKAEMQRIEAELESVKAEFDATEDQLEILGMTKAAIQKLSNSSTVNSYSDVTSRIAGIVISKHVNIGQVVQPADELFSVADLKHLWAVAEVPEQQVAFIQKDQEVTIDIPALDDKRVKGKIIYVGDIVNPETRTVLIRTEIDNSNQMLKPDMLISLTVQSKKVSKLAVPTTAVVRENDRSYVFAQTGTNKFRLREIEVGSRDGDMISILSGIAIGETVVVDGAFHLNNERRKNLNKDD